MTYRLRIWIDSFANEINVKADTLAAAQKRVYAWAANEGIEVEEIEVI